MHEKEFPNLKVDHFAQEAYYKKRKERINGYIRELKKEFFGNPNREVYCQVFMIHESRANYGPIKIDAPGSASARIKLS
jgi:hypothetical protein